jgi:hypothetical protein
LNLYGFQRVVSGRDWGAYFHPLFLRSRKDLAKTMYRTRIKGEAPMVLLPQNCCVADSSIAASFYTLPRCPPTPMAMENNNCNNTGRSTAVQDLAPESVWAEDFVFEEMDDAVFHPEEHLSVQETSNHPPDSFYQDEAYCANLEPIPICSISANTMMQQQQHQYVSHEALPVANYTTSPHSGLVDFQRMYYQQQEQHKYQYHRCQQQQPPRRQPLHMFFHQQQQQFHNQQQQQYTGSWVTFPQPSSQLVNREQQRACFQENDFWDSGMLNDYEPLMIGE